MTKIVISGASGDLGRKVTELLLQDLPASALRLTTRSPEKLSGTVPAEVEIVAADHRDPAGMEAAYRGGEVLLLISGTDISKRVPLHRQAIDAAKKVGIKQIVYTSYTGIHPQNPQLAARDHIRTEADLKASGLDYTILRDATYADWVYRLSIAPALRSGVWIQIKGEGRCAPIDKADVVRSVAAVLRDPPFHANAVYELSGPDLLSFRQIAEMASEVFHKKLEIRELTPEQRLAEWDKLGVPRSSTGSNPEHADALWVASDELVSGETAIARHGYQGILTDHVWFLTGRRPRPFRDILTEYATEADQSGSTD